MEDFNGYDTFIGYNDHPRRLDHAWFAYYFVLFRMFAVVLGDSSGLLRLSCALAPLALGVQVKTCNERRRLTPRTHRRLFSVGVTS